MRRSTLLELLDVAVFNLFHECFSAEKIGVEVSHDLSRNHEQLVVNHL